MPSRAYVPVILLTLLGLSAAPLLAQGASARGGGGGGPPFCRSGAGHPVHGMAWCVQKGWAHAGHAYRIPARIGGWEILRMDDAHFRHRGPVRYDRALDRRDLIALLGESVLGRIEGNQARDRRGTPIQGRWVRDGFDGYALELRSGSTPVLILQDATGDGRVDRAYRRPMR
jgi:hypothetical protein